MPKTTQELQDEHVTPEEVVGRVAVWTVAIRNQEPVTFLVKIADSRRLWGRIDLLVETNTGDRFWTSNQTVKLLELTPTEE